MQKKMIHSGNVKKERKNPNDPARFIGKPAVTEDGEAANIRNYLDTDKVTDLERLLEPERREQVFHKNAERLFR